MMKRTTVATPALNIGYSLFLCTAKDILGKMNNPIFANSALCCKQWHRMGPLFAVAVSRCTPAPAPRLEHSENVLLT